MNNISTIIISAVVSVLILLISRSYPDPTLDGLLGRLWILPVYFVLVPVLLGILRYNLSKENKFKNAFISFGISVLVAIITLIPFIFK